MQDSEAFQGQLHKNVPWNLWRQQLQRKCMLSLNTSHAPLAPKHGGDAMMLTKERKLHLCMLQCALPRHRMCSAAMQTALHSIAMYTQPYLALTQTLLFGI